MKKVLCVLLVILLVFALAAAGGYGVAWYRSSHIFIQGDAYPLSSTELDLREKELSIQDYNDIQAQLPYCKITWMVPFQGAAYASDVSSLTVTSLTSADLDLMQAYFPKLSSLDATGCKDYALLAEFQERMPKCKVSYQVDLGGKAFDPDAKELTLSVGEYDYDTMLANLIYLTDVKNITLKMPDLTVEQVDSLKAAYEGITIHCTAEILGKEYDTETTELNLSALTSADVAEVAEKLPLLPGLATVELMDTQGKSQLAKADVKTLMAAAPQAVFNYTFDFFGVTVSTADEEVIVKNTKIGDENEEEVRLTLDLLTNCKRFVLDNCKLTDEVMAQIREDYRDQTKVVWRVWFGKGSSLTDAQIMRAVYDLVDDNCHDLVYCEDVIFMDIGHNEWLDTCDFVAGMPNLQYVIVSGAPIKDLTPFQNCKKLKLLEIAFCEYVTDLTPLAGCESLEMLNISNTHALDLTPLDDLPLTHFVAKHNPSGKSRVSQEEQERFIAQHPDCWTSFAGEQPYGPGWRYDEDGITPLPYYAKMREVFRYEIYPKTPNHVGWYLTEEQEEAL